jgi:hypothetical protein
MSKKKKQEENALNLYRRLADISFQTSITILAIIFAFAFNPQGVTPIAKQFIFVVCWLVIPSVMFSTIALFGKKEELRFVKILGSLSIILTAFTVIVMVIFLTTALP